MPEVEFSYSSGAVIARSPTAPQPANPRIRECLPVALLLYHSLAVTDHPDSDPSSGASASDEFWLNLATHPHDAFFKEIFSNPEDAIAFFRSHLPVEIVRFCDWNSLEVLPGSFVKSTLQQTHSDLLFSVQMQSITSNATNGEPQHTEECLLYLLFEHQSSVDQAMPLRLLSYMVQIYLSHHEKRGLPLPPVIGFVLHQGPDKWTVSQQFCDLFDIPQSSPLRPFLPTFDHGLLDLSQFDPALNEQEPGVRIVLQLMKFARDKRLLEFFDWLMKACAPLLDEGKRPERRI